VRGGIGREIRGIKGTNMFKVYYMHVWKSNEETPYNLICTNKKLKEEKN
jgi:hypothetical protein